MRTLTLLAALLLSAPGTWAQQPEPPHILLDQSPRAVEYQLNRLTNDELTRVERRPADPKYRPVYVALLTRKGMTKAFRDEALAALVTIDQHSATRVLLEALARVPVADDVTADRLTAMLVEQPQAILRQQRDDLASGLAMTPRPGEPAPASAASTSNALAVRRAAFVGLVMTDGSSAAWQRAVADRGPVAPLLRGVALVPSEALRAELFQPIAALVADSTDADVHSAAIAALPWTRRDTAAFRLLAQQVMTPSDNDSQPAAIRALGLFPQAVWPVDELDPLVRAIVELVRDTPADQRTEPSTVDALQLADALSAALPDAVKLPIRRDLRAMGVQVVTIDTLPEQMLFDVKWFPVEAGRPIQIVFHNADAMPHNLVIGRPKSVSEIGNAAAALTPPSDPAAKAYIPNSPLVLNSTRLAADGDTLRLNFVAPKEPGEYVYLCTFPGHWVRMYGVMLVVGDLEAWEAHPTVPIDPVTNQPFTSRRN